MSITVRDSSTVNRLIDIWESAVRATHLFLTERDIESLIPELKQAVLGITHLYCFCDDNGTKKGFIGIENNRIEMLFVHASSRGEGIGKKLMNYVIQNLDAKYVDVNEQNAQGVGFYNYLGCKVIGRSEFDEQGRPFPILHLEVSG
jgi:putative acetyltransferase